MHVTRHFAAISWARSIGEGATRGQSVRTVLRAASVKLSRGNPIATLSTRGARSVLIFEFVARGRLMALGWMVWLLWNSSSPVGVSSLFLPSHRQKGIRPLCEDGCPPSTTRVLFHAHAASSPGTSIQPSLALRGNFARPRRAIRDFQPLGHGDAGAVVRSRVGPRAVGSRGVRSQHGPLGRYLERFRSEHWGRPTVSFAGRWAV
jgi:hypothetical protein